MPQSINVGGSQVYRSGVYGNPDVSALNGRTLSSGVLAIIGEFPWMEQGVPAEAVSEDEMRRLCLGNATLNLVTQLAWHASADDRVGTPSAVFLVSAQPTTRATKTLLDTGGGNAVVLDAAFWGPTGNKTRFVVEAGTTSGKKLTAQVLGGDSESYDDIEYPDVLSIGYTGSAMGGMLMAFDPATALTIDWAKSWNSGDVPGTWTPSPSMPTTGAVSIDPSLGPSESFEYAGLALGTWNPADITLAGFNGGAGDFGNPTVGPSEPPGGGETFTATITGTGVGGGPLVEALSWAAGESGALTTVGNFVTVASILFEASAGTPTFTVTGLKAGNTHTALVSGTNETTGLADTETLTWTAGQGGVKLTTKLWSMVTSIAFGGTSVTAPDFDVSAAAFDLDVADYDTPATIVDYINTFTNFTAEAADPATAALDMATLDALTSTTCNQQSASLTANLQAIIDALADSQIVVATRATGATLPPVNSAGFLTGGTATSTDGTGWTAAYAGLRTVECNVLVPLSTTESVHNIQRDHIAYMCGAGAFERAGWIAAPALSTLTTLKARVNAQNTRHESLVYQSPTVYDSLGKLRALTPEYFALLSAALECGVKRGSTMLRKRPNVVDLVCNTGIKPAEDADALIKASIVTAVKDTIGWRYERTVTTWRTNDNPVLTERAANRSMNDSILDLRQYLIDQIGEGMTASASGLVRSTCLTRLDWQILNKLIGGYDPNSLSIVPLIAGGYSVTYNETVVGPINFIVLNPHVQQEGV